MKLRLLALATFALFTAALAHGGDDHYKEPFSRTAPFNADGLISLHNVNGNIAIATWDKNEIRIEGEKHAKTEEELKRIELTMDLSESRAQVRVRLPKRSGGWLGGSSIRGGVTFRLTVPATAKLDAVKTVNSSVTLEGLRGAARVETVNGRISAKQLGGDADFRTVNGQLEADFSRIAAQQNLSFHTVNGSIAIALPADAGAMVHASVVNGHIECDFPTEVQGRIRGKNFKGKIGDGRAAREAESVNGSIALRKR